MRDEDIIEIDESELINDENASNINNNNEAVIPFSSNSATRTNSNSNNNDSPKNLHDLFVSGTVRKRKQDPRGANHAEYMEIKKKKLRQQFHNTINNDYALQLANTHSAAISLASSSNSTTTSPYNKQYHHSSNNPSSVNEPQQISSNNNDSSFNRLSRLFEGVTIYVNGFTKPGHSELKALMKQYGGNFEQYFSLERVTHIIATNLTPAKVKELKGYKRPPPCVLPQWILDSIEKGRLLNCNDYVLPMLKDSTQRSLFISFAQTQQQQQQSTLSINEKGTSGGNSGSPVRPSAGNVATSPTTGTPTKRRTNTDIISHILSPSSIIDDTIGTPSTSAAADASNNNNNNNNNDSVTQATSASTTPTTNATQTSYTNDHTRITTAADGLQPQAKVRLSPPPPVASSLLGNVTITANGSNNNSNNRQSPSSSRIGGKAGEKVGLPRNTDSEMTAKGFVGGYLRSSRLHFIGTWRKRYTEIAERAKQAHKVAKRLILNCGEAPTTRLIVHIDMDCFFASVAIRDDPTLANKPVAVSHSSNVNGSSEISSANYIARQKGVRAGMFMATAKSLCPDLVVVPYQFDKYEQVSAQVYEILFEFSPQVKAVSCDEAYIDFTGFATEDTIFDLIKTMRTKIVESTGCTASAGISTNAFLARMATKKAKPNGQFHLKQEDAIDFLRDFPVGELPGVGRKLVRKIQELLGGPRELSCGDLLSYSKDYLKAQFGNHTGEMLYDRIRGVDDTPFTTETERKSVGVDVNWGVRFKQQDQVDSFIDELSESICERLAEEQVSGKSITLKIKKRREGAPEPIKYMGHGICDNLSKSKSYADYVFAADQPKRIASECKQLLRQLKLNPEDIRGIGITIQKLNNAKDAPYSSCRGNKETLGIAQFFKPTSKPNSRSTNINNETYSTNNRNEDEEDQEAGSEGDDIRTSSDDSDNDKRIDSSRVYPHSADSDINTECDYDNNDTSPPRRRPHARQHHRAAVGTSVSPLRMSDLMPTPSKFDQEVLKELPDDIRKEIMNQSRAAHGRQQQPPLRKKRVSLKERFDQATTTTTMTASSSTAMNRTTTVVPPQPHDQNELGETADIEAQKHSISAKSTTITTTTTTANRNNSKPSICFIAGPGADTIFSFESMDAIKSALLEWIEQVSTTNPPLLPHEEQSATTITTSAAAAAAADSQSLFLELCEQFLLQLLDEKCLEDAQSLLRWLRKQCLNQKNNNTTLLRTIFNSLLASAQRAMRSRYGAILYGVEPL